MTDLFDFYDGPNPPITGLNLFINSTCNLNCQFCYLNKNPAYAVINKEITDSWKNKTYIPNVLKVLKKLNSHPERIDNIRFWGGESYIAIENVEKNVEDIFTAFPNVKDILISTNFTQDVDKIASFIKKVDEFSPYKSAFRFQISIDGPEGIYRETGHNVSDDIYNSQFEKFSNFINNYSFKNITRFIISVKQTIDRDVYLEKFVQMEELKKYMEYVDEFYTYLKNLFLNKVVEFGMGFPSISSPYKASAEDGMKFAQVIKNWDYLKMNYFKDSSNKSFLGNFYFSQAVLGKNRYIDGPTGGCDMYMTTIAVMPDGMIVPCNGAYVQYKEEYLRELEKQVKNKERPEIELKHALLENRGAMFNPLTATDDEIKRYKWYVIEGWGQLNTLGTHFKLGLLEEMALSGQVSWIYYGNIEERLKAAQIIGINCNCQRLNIENTGISQLVDPGDIRLYANGAVELIERDFGYYENSILRYANTKRIEEKVKKK